MRALQPPNATAVSHEGHSYSSGTATLLLSRYTVADPGAGGRFDRGGPLKLDLIPRFVCEKRSYATVVSTQWLNLPLGGPFVPFTGLDLIY
jgi:hypothetical protein